MTDDEFKGKVLRDLAAVKARQDEQDEAHDILRSQIDRLRTRVLSTLKMNELDLKQIETLGRRVLRLEHPQGGN